MFIAASSIRQRSAGIKCVPQLMKGAEARGGDDVVWACLNSWMPSLLLPPTLSLKHIVLAATAVLAWTPLMGEEPQGLKCVCGGSQL